MKKTTPIILLFLLLLLNSCGQIKHTQTISAENSKKNESNICLGLSILKADLILNNYNIQPTGFCIGDGPGPNPQFYQLPTGKILCLTYKHGVNGDIVGGMSVSKKVCPYLVGKADPEMDAFWGSFITVKEFNLKTLK